MNKLPAGLSRDLEERKKGGSQQPQSRASGERRERKSRGEKGKKSCEEREVIFQIFLKKNLFF